MVGMLEFSLIPRLRGRVRGQLELCTLSFLPGGTFPSPPMILSLSAHPGQLSHCYAELEAKHVSLTWMKGRWG